MQRLVSGREGIRYTGNRQGGFRVQGVAGGRAYDNISTGWEAPIGDGAGEIHPADVQRFQGLPGFEYVPGVPAASPTVAPNSKFVPTIKGEDGEAVAVFGEPVASPNKTEERRLAELREMREMNPASVPVDQSVLIDLEGIGPDLANKLNAIGIYTLAELSKASDEALLAVDGIGKRNLKTIRAQLTVQ